METTQTNGNGIAHESVSSDMTPTIAKLAAALAKAQARIEAADKSSINPHFRSRAPTPTWSRARFSPSKPARRWPEADMKLRHLAHVYSKSTPCRRRRPAPPR